MRRGNIFWGAILLIIGLFLLVDNLGLLDRIGLSDISAWDLLWPTVLILLGVFTLIQVISSPGAAEATSESMPLAGAREAELIFHHGAGRLEVHGDSPPDQLFAGEFGSGLKTSRSGSPERPRVTLRPADNFPFPFWFGGRAALDWRVGLTAEIPLHLEFNTGAGESRLDLRGLRAQAISLKTGASNTFLTLPEKSSPRVTVETGVSSIRINVPDGVAARIRTRGGLSSIDVDQTRFTRQGDLYLSPDYEDAEYRADIDVQVGVGSVTIG